MASEQQHLPSASAAVPEAAELPPMTVMAASVQFPSIMGDAAANEARVFPLIREAASNGAKFVVLPETCVQGYLSQDIKTTWHVSGRPLTHVNSMDPAAHAETMDGPMIARFAALAKELGVYITVPYLEKVARPLIASDDDGDADDAKEPLTETVYFNSVALVSPEGVSVGNYRKMSPWPIPEKSWATRGTEPVAVDTPYGRVGLAICFDIHSCLAKYARHRLWALLYPIAWVGEADDWFRGSLPSLLRQVNCPHYVIGCNWSTDEPHEEWPGQGYTTHYGPRGELLASTADCTGATIVYSTLFTAHAGPMRSLPPIDLDKYAAWTDKIGIQAREWTSEWS